MLSLKTDPVTPQQGIKQVLGFSNWLHFLQTTSQKELSSKWLEERNQTIHNALLSSNIFT